jgi:lipoprotein-anchoring transpeptidase ErfK/SrfK
MRRRAVLAGIAGTAGAILAQQLQVLARPVTTDDDTATAPPPSDTTPDDQPTTPASTPSAPAPVTASVPDTGPAKPVATKPNLNDPKYSPNAYPPAKIILDGPPKTGNFALTADDVNFRANPSYNSDVQKVIPGGSQVTVEGNVKDGFFPVNFQSGRGWADGKFLQRLGPEIPQPIGVGTLTESTPIYEAPDQSGKQVTNWTAGMQVTYFAEVDGTQYKGSKRWYKVLTNPDRYVPTWAVFGTPTAGLQDPSPLPKSGPLAWTGRLQGGANVRIGPGTSHQVVKSWGTGRRVLVYATVTGEAYEGSTKWYQVAAPPEQSLFLHSSFVTKEADIMRVDKPAYPGRWVDVDLTNQVLTVYYGAEPILVAQTASGTDKNPTDKGTYPTFWRLASQRMQGDNLFAADYYNLDAVPYISYFHPSGEAIHGAYWHDNFGTQLSHGCVNTSLPTAQWVLTWTPLGTQVVVH